MEVTPTICRYHTENRCWFGSKCWFPHEPTVAECERARCCLIRAKKKKNRTGRVHRVHKVKRASLEQQMGQLRLEVQQLKASGRRLKPRVAKLALTKAQESPPENSKVIQELRSQVETLKKSVDLEREANEKKDEAIQELQSQVEALRKSVELEREANEKKDEASVLGEKESLWGEIRQCKQGLEALRLKNVELISRMDSVQEEKESLLGEIRQCEQGLNALRLKNLELISRMEELVFENECLSSRMEELVENECLSSG